MSRLALACAVMLAALFTVTAQADAAGFQRYKPHIAKHHSVRKHKFQRHRVYRAHKRLRALRRFRHRFIVKRHRHHSPPRFVRRYR
jgi:Ni/Co efflux regulator RcnB